MKKIFLVVQLLALIGISLAVYLLWERYFQPSFQPCNINSVVNCTAIISGGVSNTLGIPTPIIGLFGYIGIFVGAALQMRKTIFGLATFGLIFCLYIAYRELFQLHVICPVCILCQLDMISVFILSLVMLKKS